MLRFELKHRTVQDLITKLLKVRPEERLSADEILEHPWLQDQAMRTEAHALMKEQEVKSQVGIRDRSQRGKRAFQGSRKIKCFLSKF